MKPLQIKKAETIAISELNELVTRIEEIINDADILQENIASRPLERVINDLELAKAHLRGKILAQESK